MSQCSTRSRPTPVPEASRRDPGADAPPAALLVLLERLVGAHTVVRRTESADGPRIQTTSHTEMEINRLGNVIEILADEVTLETLEGRILEIESHNVTSGQERGVPWSCRSREG